MDQTLPPCIYTERLNLMLGRVRVQLARLPPPQATPNPQLLTIFWFIGNVTGKGRIPYGDLTNLGCVVAGLPQGMEFKQPKLYSSSELRKIFDNIDSIKFLAISNFNTVTPDVGREETVDNVTRDSLDEESV